jgi:hypothetical protein
MASFWSKLVKRVKRIWQPPPPLPAPKPAPKPAPTLPAVPASLRRRARQHILDTIPLADADAIDHHIAYMDDDELAWTLDADQLQLVGRASRLADRLTDDAKPLNP